MVTQEMVQNILGEFGMHNPVEITDRSIIIKQWEGNKCYSELCKKINAISDGLTLIVQMDNFGTHEEYRRLRDKLEKECIVNSTPEQAKREPSVKRNRNVWKSSVKDVQQEVTVQQVRNWFKPKPTFEEWKKEIEKKIRR